MGCQSSKAAELGLEESEQRGPQAAKKERYHRDTAVMVCPCFRSGAQRQTCDALQRLAKEAEDSIFYGTAAGDGGVRVQQGFRSIEAALAYMRNAEAPFAEAWQSSTLERVEVYGPQRELLRMRRSAAKVGGCPLHFFHAYPQMQGVRRPTRFSGLPGSDLLVTCNVTIEVTSVQTLQALRPQLQAVQRRAMGVAGCESFCVAARGGEDAVRLVGAYDRMESVFEHLLCVVSHLGAEAVRGLEVHGCGSEMEKLRSLMRGTGEVAGKLRIVLKTAAEKAAVDVRYARACAEAAAKAAARGVSDEIKAARDRAVTTVAALQRKAEEMTQEVYRTAMATTGTTKDAARALAQKCYRRAMEAVSDLRRAADEAAARAYEAAIAAGAAGEHALRDANRAAEAGISAMHDELSELTEAARAEAETAGNAAATAAAKDVLKTAQLAQEEYEACKLSVEVGATVVAAQSQEVVVELREATLSMYHALKQDAHEAVDAVYRGERQAMEVADEAIAAARSGARAAGWAVVFGSQHVYLAAYGRAVALGGAAETAAETAARAAEGAAEKVHLVWRRGEQLVADAASSAERMVEEEESSLAKLWGRTRTYSMDTASALRWSLYRSTVVVEQEIQVATESLAYVESVAVEEVTQELEEAERGFLDRLERWHDAFVGMEVAALRAVAHVADARADRAERAQRVCC